MSRCFAISCLALAVLAAPAAVPNATAQAPRQRAARGQAQEYSAGQQSGQAEQPTAQQGRSGRAAMLNEHIAGWLLLGNQEEIVLGHLAESRAQNAQVKEFAQMMVNDHQEAVQKLTPIAPQLAQAVATLGQKTARQPAGAREEPAQAGAEPAGTEGESAAGQGRRGRDAEFALAQRIAEECLSLQTNELNQKQGAEFDECYMNAQVAGHLDMLAKLRGSQAFASGELQQVIGELTGTVQKHLDHAKQLAKQLKSEGGQRPETSQLQRPGAAATSR
jgi:predicted outer membrane protein